MLSRSALLHSRGSLPGPPAGEGCFSERIRVGVFGEGNLEGVRFWGWPDAWRRNQEKR